MVLCLCFSTCRDSDTILLRCEDVESSSRSVYSFLSECDEWFFCLFSYRYFDSFYIFVCLTPTCFVWRYPWFSFRTLDNFISLSRAMECGSFCLDWAHFHCVHDWDSNAFFLSTLLYISCHIYYILSYIHCFRSLDYIMLGYRYLYYYVNISAFVFTTG